MLPMLISDFRKGLNKDWKIAIPTGCILSAIFYCEVFGVLHTSCGTESPDWSCGTEILTSRVVPRALTGRVVPRALTGRVVPRS